MRSYLSLQRTVRRARGATAATTARAVRSVRREIPADPVASRIGEPSLGLYAINLRRAPERWNAILDGFGELPWPLLRVQALDALTDVDCILSVRGLTLSHPPHGVGWNPLRFRMFSLVEEAVFASHLLALRRFLASEHRFGLILEDDAEPLRELDADLRVLVDGPTDFAIVKLEGLKRTGRHLAVRERSWDSGALVRSPTPSSGAAAYLVTRRAARRLIANAGRHLYRFDDYLSNPTLCGCEVHHLAPYPIRQSSAESTMHALRKPVRDIRRRGARYRLLQALRRVRLRLAPWRRFCRDLGRDWRRLRLARWA